MYTSHPVPGCASRPRIGHRLPTLRVEDVRGVGGTAEALLRHPRRIQYHLRQPDAVRLLLSLLLIAVVCSAIYGLVVGTFSKGDQLWVAPLKISLGLLMSGLICLPSLYIFACLSGAHVRMMEAAGLVIGLMALLSVLLVGFAPVAWVFSESTQSVPAMGTLHLVFGLVAVWFGLRFLMSGLVHAQAGAGGIRVWSFILLIVLLQMTTALRPILGTATTLLPDEKKFFMTHWADSFGSDNPKP